MPSSVVCPHCGVAAPEGALFCPRDGVSLSSTSATDRALPPTERELEGTLRPPSSSDGSPPDLARGEGLFKDALIGTRVGEYVIEARIGLGGMGIVYRGRQPEIGKSVAIKVLRPEIADEPVQVNRLLSEARVVNAIGHRGIVDIFSFGRLPDGRTYFVMELLQGEPLDAHLSRRGALPVAEAIPLLEDLLTVLGAAHATGVVHRDLKPSNLFLVRQSDGASFLKILDFGLAKNTAATGRSMTSGMIVGTPEFMAPEQITGDPVTPRTDLYSVGVIAYELLTGKLPFESATSIAYLVLHLEKEPTPLSKALPEIDPDLEELVLRLLAKSPDDRPPSAEQVRLELRDIRMRLQASGVAMKERAFDSGASPRSGPEPSEARPKPTARPKAPVRESRETVAQRTPRPKAPTVPDFPLAISPPGSRGTPVPPKAAPASGEPSPATARRSPGPRKTKSPTAPAPSTPPPKRREETAASAERGESQEPAQAGASRGGESEVTNTQRDGLPGRRRRAWALASVAGLAVVAGAGIVLARGPHAAQPVAQPLPPVTAGASQNQGGRYDAPVPRQENSARDPARASSPESGTVTTNPTAGGGGPSPTGATAGALAESRQAPATPEAPPQPPSGNDAPGASASKPAPLARDTARPVITRSAHPAGPHLTRAGLQARLDHLRGVAQAKGNDPMVGALLDQAGQRLKSASGSSGLARVAEMLDGIERNYLAASAH